jgi:hypothetical protein
MKRNFNISEILTSVDVIVATNKNKSNNKNKINDEYKELDKTIIDMSDNPITEKIIMDAERYLKNKILENSSDKIKQKPLALNTLISSNIDLSKRLILNEEYAEEKKIEDYDLIEEDIEEGNNLKELENNYISENKLLKSENTKQGEIIKDLNILLNNFKKKKVYSGLYNKIKLYQEDNAVLRKKILDQSDAERRLKLQLAALNE